MTSECGRRAVKPELGCRVGVEDRHPEDRRGWWRVRGSRRGKYGREGFDGGDGVCKSLTMPPHDRVGCEIGEDCRCVPAKLTQG